MSQTSEPSEQYGDRVRIHPCLRGHPIGTRVCEGWLLGAGADGGPVLGHARRTSASAFAGTLGGCATARGTPIGPDPDEG